MEDGACSAAAAAVAAGPAVAARHAAINAEVLACHRLQQALRGGAVAELSSRASVDLAVGDASCWWQQDLLLVLLVIQQLHHLLHDAAAS